MDTSLRIRPLSTRTVHILEKAGVETLAGLAKLTAIDLLKMPDMGRLSVEEIKAYLLSHGLLLSGERLPALQMKEKARPILEILDGERAEWTNKDGVMDDDNGAIDRAETAAALIRELLTYVR